MELSVIYDGPVDSGKHDVDGTQVLIFFLPHFRHSKTITSFF